MLRIRIDGGALTTEQLRVIGQISVDFARTPPMSPTGRMSNCIGFESKTFPRSGVASRRSASNHRGLRRLSARDPRLPGGRDCC